MDWSHKMKLNFNADTHSYFVDVGGQIVSVPSVTTINRELLNLDFSFIKPFYLDRGIQAHKTIELWIEKDLDESSVEPRLVPYLNAFKKFVAGTKFIVTASEKIVWCEKLWVAGTIDLLGELQGKPVLIDIKTGGKQDHYHLQTAGYAILNKTPDIKRFCLHLDQKEKYKLEPHLDAKDIDVFQGMAHYFNKREKYGWKPLSKQTQE